MMSYRLMVFVGAFIGMIGFLVYFLTSFKIKRISSFKSQELRDSLFLDICSSLLIVKYFKLKKEVKVIEAPSEEIMSDLQTLRIGLISIGVLLFGLVIQIIGMLGKAGKLG